MMLGKNNESINVLSKIPENSVGVELGVWKGESSERFASKTKRLHLVDAWAPEPYKESTEHGSFENYISRYSQMVGSKNPDDFKKFYDSIYNMVKEKFSNNPNVILYRMSTKDFFKGFEEQVDWVYVDAAHDHNGCYHDLVNCLKIIKKGGKILGDDYNNKPGVKSAVDQFVKDHQMVLDNFFGNQYEIMVK
jgi:hypothetical protein